VDLRNFCLALDDIRSQLVDLKYIIVFYMNFLSLFFVFFGAGIELKALLMLGKHSTTELHPQPCINYSKKSQV
jgi:hypothetical protein